MTTQWAKLAVERRFCPERGRIIEPQPVTAACGGCGDQTASLYGFDDEPGLCARCGWPQEPRPEAEQQTLGV